MADQDSKPARKIQEELELENITAARNLIQRARTHGYLSPANSKIDERKNEIEILPAAFADAEDIRNLRNLARSIGSKP